MVEMLVDETVAATVALLGHMMVGMKAVLLVLQMAELKEYLMAYLLVDLMGRMRADL